MFVPGRPFQNPLAYTTIVAINDIKSFIGLAQKSSNLIGDKGRNFFVNKLQRKFSKSFWVKMTRRNNNKKFGNNQNYKF